MKKHTKTIILVIVGAAILIGGTWGVNESRYPNAPAFDDHFTRKFLNKDKKVDDGFYEFKSKTGQYTMWFPEEYQMLHDASEYYSVNGKSYENWSASYRKMAGKNKSIYYIKAEFLKNDKKFEPIYVKELFQEQLKDSNPKEIETSRTRIYYDYAYAYFKGTERHVVHNSKVHLPNTYTAYVADKSSNKVIEFSYDSIGKGTETSQEKRKLWFLTILKSINFSEDKSRE
ncbi:MULTISPECIES: hypothetical protein [Priestia]|uniref:Uncharacterized protein n=1 Tax=Priestia megaterium TaxID=1404 RepID=A0AAX6BFM3_PRIMG|nr:hypothetical protein [Priestia megaterium]UOO40505.1 hypothetical protein I0292_22380 [Priestia megaterium]GMG72556.1 hypothetical protein ShirakiTB12_10240 [Priestia megaterium]